ncbi:MAG: hypothetical protein Q8K26_01805 [Candidatus Gracilibacteria bacterium]|nr:hypothetical protein [Candidatus Gracilibacteria bacterium]
MAKDIISTVQEIKNISTKEIGEMITDFLKKNPDNKLLVGNLFKGIHGLAKQKKESSIRTVTKGGLLNLKESTTIV